MTDEGTIDVGGDGRTAPAGRSRLPRRPDWWRVRDVMTTSVVRVGPDAPRDAIVDLLLAHGVSGLPVTDDAGHLLGVVTEADLVRGEVGREAAAAPGAAGTAAQLMTRGVCTASPDDDLPSTARRLVDTGHRRLPVVDDAGRLVGVVSRRDLLAPAWDDCDV